MVLGRLPRFPKPLQDAGFTNQEVAEHGSKRAAGNAEHQQDHNPSGVCGETSDDPMLWSLKPIRSRFRELFLNSLGDSQDLGFEEVWCLDGASLRCYAVCASSAP